MRISVAQVHVFRLAANSSACFFVLVQIEVGRFGFAMMIQPWDKAREIFFSRIAHAKTPAMRRRREEEYAEFVDFLGTQAEGDQFIAAMHAALKDDMLAFPWFAEGKRIKSSRLPSCAIRADRNGRSRLASRRKSLWLARNGVGKHENGDDRQHSS
jgi:hypothetical protein